MLLEFLESYAWIIWLALILIFVIVEVMTLEFTFLMLAVGSLGGLLSGLFGLPWWAQVIVAGILSLLLLLVVRPALLRALGRGAHDAPTNVEALIGLSGVVTTDFSGNPTNVKLVNGDVWTARDLDGSPLLEGDTVVVAAIDGATAVVSTVERN